MGEGVADVRLVGERKHTLALRNLQSPGVFKLLCSVSVSKLKRDSGINFDVQLDTERLLQQKEHEIQQMKEMLKAMHAQLAVKGNNGVAGRSMNGVGH